LSSRYRCVAGASVGRLSVMADPVVGVRVAWVVVRCRLRQVWIVLWECWLRSSAVMTRGPRGSLDQVCGCG
jgi:hypothetical protein